MAYDLSGDGDAGMFVSTLAPGLLRARGQVLSQGCRVSVALAEKDLYPGRVGDAVTVRLGPFYRAGVLSGVCGNFDGDRDNDRLCKARGFSYRLGMTGWQNCTSGHQIS